jgi:hypothetical protein
LPRARRGKMSSLGESKNLDHALAGW